MRTAILLAAIAFGAPAAFADSDSAFPGRSVLAEALPNNWIMGQAAGVAVDAQDHVWVIQRPSSADRRREGGGAQSADAASAARRPRR